MDTSIAYAQPQKGAIYIGGSISGNYDAGNDSNSRYERPRYYMLNLSPQSGIFINKYLALNLKTNYNVSSTKDYYTNRKTRGFTAGPGISAYFKIYKPFYLVLNSSVTYSSVKYSENTISSQKINFIDVGGGPELLCFVSPRFALYAETAVYKRYTTVVSYNNSFKHESRFSTLQIGFKTFFYHKKSERINN